MGHRRSQRHAKKEIALVDDPKLQERSPRSIRGIAFDPLLRAL